MGPCEVATGLRADLGVSVPRLPEGVSLEDIPAELVELRRVVAAQAERIAELERRASADSSNPSRPPSSDATWAKKRSSRGHSARKPGKQSGPSPCSWSLVDDFNRTVVLETGTQSCLLSTGKTTARRKQASWPNRRTGFSARSNGRTAAARSVFHSAAAHRTLEHRLFWHPALATVRTAPSRANAVTSADPGIRCGLRLSGTLCDVATSLDPCPS